MKFTILLALASGIILNAQSSAIDKAIQQKIAPFHGTVSIYAKNLRTGASYGLRENAPVRTASTIKLAIMAACFSQASEGKLDWKTPVTLKADDIVSGSGVLQDFTPGDVLPIRDLVDLMIVLSDNTATNLVLDHVPANTVNAYMAKLGLQQTRAMRKILGDRNDLKPEPSGMSQDGLMPENKKWGIGRTSPYEMVELLEKIYRGELVNQAASAEMLKILKRQRDHDGIARDVKDAEVANKTGALDALRADVGIVLLKDAPIAMAIYVDDMPEPDWTPDNPGELLIAWLSEVLMKDLAPAPIQNRSR